MSYYKLPTRKRIYWVSIPSVLIYVGLVFLANTFFPELGDYWKKKLSQAGLTVIFASGLFAGLGFIWSAKARHNLDLARIELEQSKAHQEMLERIRDKLNQDLETEINKELSTQEKAQEYLNEAENFPRFVNFAGFISLIFLGIGTLMCIVGEG